MFSYFIIFRTGWYYCNKIDSNSSGWEETLAVLWLWLYEGKEIWRDEAHWTQTHWAAGVVWNMLFWSLQSARPEGSYEERSLLLTEPLHWQPSRYILTPFTRPLLWNTPRSVSSDGEDWRPVEMLRLQIRVQAQDWHLQTCGGQTCRDFRLSLSSLS